MYRNKRRRVRLPLRSYLLCLTLLSFLLTGVTFSKYVTRSSGGDSARVVRYGNVAIAETEPANGWTIVPGVNITKQATVNVSASEVDNYIFVQVDVVGYTTTDNQNFKQNNMLSWSVDESWEYLPTTGNSYVYWTYLDTNTPLVKDIIKGNTITVSEDITEKYLETYCGKDKVSIDFTAYMVQAGGFSSAAEAWDAIND